MDKNKNIDKCKPKRIKDLKSDSYIVQMLFGPEYGFRSE